MLEYLRNAAEKPVAKILIGILAFSFVGWGVAEWIFGGVSGDNTLVRIGGTEITMNRFSQARSQELAKLSRDEQRALYTDAAAMLQFSNQVMARISSEAMTAARADALGFVVSDHRIVTQVRNAPEFQVNGQFAPYAFDAALANSGYSEAEFAAAMRAQILREMVLAPLNKTVPVPDFAVTAAYNARYGQRQIEYVNVRYADFQVDAPTEQQLRDFYAQNPHVIEETRAASYVLVPAEMDKPDAYDAAYATAQKVEDDIIGGETLSAAAARHNVKYRSFDAFGADARPADAVMIDSMVSKIFSMDEGTESELIETKQGFVIVRVDRVNPRHNAEFDSARNGMDAAWRRAEQRKQAYVRANEILTAAKQSGHVADARAQMVSRADGAPLQVLAAAYSAHVGDTVIVDGDDSFYVMRVVGENAPTVDAAKKAALRKEMQDAATRNATDDYNAFLMRTYPVKVNKRVYDKFFAK